MFLDTHPQKIAQSAKTGYLAIGASAPAKKADLRYGDVGLADSDAAKAYRANYAEPAAPAPPPQVSICDTISSDTWGTARAWFATAPEERGPNSLLDPKSNKAQACHDPASDLANSIKTGCIA